MTKRLLLFWVASTCLLNLALSRLPEPWNETVFTHLARFVRGEIGRDSWGPMEVGLDHVASGAPGRPYDVVFFQRRIKLQYPPTALLALDAVQRIGRGLGVTTDRLLLAIAWLMLLTTAWAASLLLRAPRWPGALFALTFYPLIKGCTLGQIQVWLDALFALLFWAWLGRRKGLAGALLGAIVLVKPHYALLVLWGLLRGERRFASSALIVIAPVLAASLARFGFRAHVNYLDVLSFLSRHGEAFHPNQSLNGLLQRAFGNGSNLVWTGDAFPPFHPWIFALTLIGSAALVLTPLIAVRSGPGKAGLADLGAMALAVTLASPIAWEHHFGILLPLFAVLYSRLDGAAMQGRAAARLASGYVLTSNYFAVAQALAATPLNVLQSYLFFGALLALALLLAAARAEVPVSGAAGA
jgi:hypothetical protein